MNQRKERMPDLRLDRSGEKITGDIKSFLHSQDIKLEPSPAVGERRIPTLSVIR